MSYKYSRDKYIIEVKDDGGNIISSTGEFGVIYLPTNTSIPANLNNKDYREFLKWKEDGGVPEDADPEPETPKSLLNAQDRMRDIDWQKEQKYIKDNVTDTKVKLILLKMHQRMYAMARIMSLTIDELTD